MGDGRNIRLWTDSWLGFATPLQLLFLRLYNLSLQQSISLADVYSLTDSLSNLFSRRSIRSCELCMRESLITEVEHSLVFFKGEDIKIWIFYSSDVCSVHSGCHLLDSLSASENPSSTVLLWKGFAPPKVGVFM